MVTVWTFFGSDDSACGDGAGKVAGAVAGAGGAAPNGDAGCAFAVVGGALDGMDADGIGRAVSGGGLCGDAIGMVETTRELTLGGSMFTGCSSRETIFSVAVEDGAPSWLVLLGCDSP